MAGSGDVLVLVVALVLVLVGREPPKEAGALVVLARATLMAWRQGLGFKTQE